MWPWPFDPKVRRTHSWLMGSMPVKFYENTLRRSSHAHETILPNLCIVTFDPKVDRAHPWLMGSVPLKFHENRCKGEAVMRIKPFYLTHAFWPWPLDPKVDRTHPWLMGSAPVKFYEDRSKGEAFMRMKPNHVSTDGRTDGQYTSITPPNFIVGV